MKPKTNLIKNLSLPIVAFTAGISSILFHLAIAKGATAQTANGTAPQPELLPESAAWLAQVWSDVDVERLSLATPTLTSNEDEIFITQLPVQSQLVAQLWSNVDVERLSLATPETEPQQNRELIAELPTSTPQFIAQLWSDVDADRLSLAVPEPANSDDEIFITQLPVQQQLVAQLWSNVDVDRLSLATPQPVEDQTKSRQLITQLAPQQQQTIAQLWSNIDVERLSLATSKPAIKPANPDKKAILIAQLTPQAQKLIAQQWSDVDSTQLSLASPENLSPALAAGQPLINKLAPESQKLIAQLWRDLRNQELSFAANPVAEISPQATAKQPQANILISKTLDAQAKSTATDWSYLNGDQLSLEFSADNLDPIALLNQPVVEEDAPPILSKQEIAARIVLDKVQIITPAPGVIIDGSSNSSVTVQYPHSSSVELKVNGKEVDDRLVTREQVDFNTNLVTQTWDGAKLREGKNQVSIIARKSGFDSEITREVIVKNDTADLASAAEAEAEAEAEIDSTSPQAQNRGREAKKKPAEESKPQPSFSQGDRDSASFIKILTPKPDQVLKNISSSVIIQYPEEASVILQVNGKSVNAAQVGRTEVNAITKIVTQTWYGVIFDSGANNLSILATTDGSNYTEKSIEVHVPGKPAALKVGTVEAHIPADGQSIATVEGEFLDKKGKTAAWNETITLNSSEGKFVGNDLDLDRPGFQVRTNKGKFTASLQAGYDAENVTIQAKSGQLEAFTRMQFKSTLREKPLLTGFADLRIGARGTDYYDNFRDFLPLDEDNNAELDFTSAAFIQGSLGRWSYTGAYNSDRALNEDSRGENRLFRTYSNNEQNYPLYGDSSTSEVVAPSTDSVYLRLERNSKIEFAEPDYFMWGDYNTEEFATESQEFSAINRQLHGFKANYNLGDLQLNGFYANNAEGFQRDAIAPDGTSGFYFLSRRLLVPGSEEVYLELTPLNDPGNVVSRQRLSLGVDYEIDYDRGTLLFNDPVLNTEADNNGNILVRRIVSTYQFEEESSDSTLLGGRARYYFDRDLNQPTWLGLSYLDEDRGDLDFRLFGFDTFVSLGNWGTLTGEYANSNNETVFADASGSAYRFEGEVKFSDDIQGRVYYSQTDEGFANNATLSFVPGQTRYGSQITAQVADRTSLNFLYERQDNEGVAPRPLDELEDFLDPTFSPVPGNQLDNNLSTITAGIEQKIGKAELGADLTWRDRDDNSTSGDLNSTSTQLRSRFSIPVVNKLTFHALSDLTLSDNTDAVFSDRLGVGLDWEFYDGLSLVLNHQWFTRGSLAGEDLTTFGLQGEYNPWANTTLTGRYSIANGIDGINNVGSIGLQQKVPITSGLNLDLDYEHTFDNADRDGTGTQFTQPFAVGQGASALSFGSGSTYGVGIEYTDNPDFTADARWQYSNRANGGNTVISAGVTGKLTSSLTSLLSYNQASSASQEFDIGTTRSLRLGLAYRNPKQDKFNALFRYEYEENGGLIPESLLISQGTSSREHLFGIEGIYAPNWRWEFYSKYAFRNDKTFIADDFESSSNVSLGQIRATYRLNYHMDLVAEGRMIWQPSADYTETGIVLEAGYYLTPELRLSGGYVFGSADDEDFTGTRSAGGPYVGVTVKLNSLLDGFGQHSPPTIPEGVPKQKKSASSESKPQTKPTDRTVDSPPKSSSQNNTTKPSERGKTNLNKSQN